MVEIMAIFYVKPFFLAAQRVELPCISTSQDEYLPGRDFSTPPCPHFCPLVGKGMGSWWDVGLRCSWRGWWVWHCVCGIRGRIILYANHKGVSQAAASHASAVCGAWRSGRV